MLKSTKEEINIIQYRPTHTVKWAIFSTGDCRETGAGPSLAGLGQLIRIAAIPKHEDNGWDGAGQLRVDSETQRVQHASHVAEINVR